MIGRSDDVHTVQRVGDNGRKVALVMIGRIVQHLYMQHSRYIFRIASAFQTYKPY